MIIFFGWLLILIGLVFIISGIIGLFRFKNFYTKLHASSVIECCGGPLCLLGLALIHSGSNYSIKLILITVLILILNPLSTHTLSQSALIYKINRNLE